MRFLLNKVGISTRLFFFLFVFIFCHGTLSSQEIIKIGFEGMPGSGKTSTLVLLAQEAGEGCLLLPEINIEENPHMNQQDDLWMEYHNLWKKRLSILKKLKGNRLIFMDRTYFTNLAFTYAFFGGANSEEYKIQKSIVNNDFEGDIFDVIFFFDVSPELGLKRRNQQGDFPLYPWSSISFLKKLRKFYHEEFPKLYHGKIVYIITETLNKEQLLELVYADICRRFKDKIKWGSVHYNSSEEEKVLLDYASRRKDLGQPYSRGFYVMNFPTVYFRQFALQLENKNIFILNNDRLDQILRNKK